MNYEKFIKQKQQIVAPSGFSVSRDDINPGLFEFQKDIVKWALKRGRAAIFAGTGLGKSRMQVEWGQKIHELTGGDVLLLAPLAVAAQTVREGAALGYEVHLCRSQDDVKPGLNITNYEMLHHFEPILFSGIVLDESSILKSFTGKIRNEIIESFAFTPYRLACTATPAPNDYMELGNHAEFLGVMSRTEMLSMYFVHDGGRTSQWRLKGHAESDFWAWVASWGVVLEKPSDLGYEDGAFKLPPLNIHEIIVPAEGPPANTLTERRQARKNSLNDRVAYCAELINQTDDTWLIWCDLNDESDALTKAIEGAVEVRGSHKPAYKEKAMLDFAAGDIKRLVSKSSICGFGMNFQVCNRMAFVGLSDSFEQIFQAIRRCWRFGQTKPVDVYIITAETEGAVLENIKRKEQDFKNMVDEMVRYTQGILSESIRSSEREMTKYNAEKHLIIPEWLRSEPIAS
ncbi:helicase domain protein [Desulforamulus reducens MI-1]|uniref:Helicase domain protein n=1 Tax=Desulforamulus reducens (strain ATCC BAA-1160 / DSM 100696 / MI-1) TaxID=349161 RepID=A4J3S3_DESRM|nr:helicase-related protein [Desulforamulus reducens]ABO49726.1 helicase domain protein [Desulforamulus reducens MI-1]